MAGRAEPRGGVGGWGTAAIVGGPPGTGAAEGVGAVTGARGPGAGSGAVLPRSYVGPGLRALDTLSSFRSRFLRRSSSDGRSWATTPAPAVTMATVTRPRTANFNLESSMALRIPSVRVMTEVEATSAREEPDATKSRTDCGIDEERERDGLGVLGEGRSERGGREGQAAPRETVSQAKFTRARRLERVPSDTPRRAAASRRERPLSSHSSMAAGVVRANLRALRREWRGARFSEFRPSAEPVK